MKKIATIALAVLCGTMFGAGSLRAEAAKDTAGEMTVSDKAGMFSEAGVKKAKDAFHDTTFHARTEFHVEVYANIPEGKLADYEKVKNDTAAKNRFFGDWAVELAKAHKSKGIFLLISRVGGHVHAIDDRQTDAKRSFDDSKLKKVEEKIAAGFASAVKHKDHPEEAKKLRDDGLMDATNYLIAELKDTTVPVSKQAAKHDGGNKGMSSIWGYVCIGAVVLLGIWLVVGIFRALTNRGGGGGGGYGGGGGGYGGGGGGGFMSGMLGGLFGGMAGMWMYNNMFGGSHASDMSAGQGGTGDTGSGDYNDTGAGDYDGGGDGGGTSFDDGGGADTGGGGDWGDSGGGGDFGGGGGDFGGGGGDW